MTQEEINAIVADAEECIKTSQSCLDETNEVDRIVKFLQDEYVKNKRYFCSEGSRPTINDVIRTCVEFGWQAKNAYDYNNNKIKVK